VVCDSKKKKKKKKERKDLGLTIDVQRQKVYFGKEIVLIGERVEKKKLIEMSEDDKVPIILENIYHFYHYFFVSYFPSLNPTLRPDKSPYLILRNVWFRNFHD